MSPLTLVTLCKSTKSFSFLKNYPKIQSSAEILDVLFKTCPVSASRKLRGFFVLLMNIARKVEFKGSWNLFEEARRGGISGIKTANQTRYFILDLAIHFVCIAVPLIITRSEISAAEALFFTCGWRWMFNNHSDEFFIGYYPPLRTTQQTRNTGLGEQSLLFPKF